MKNEQWLEALKSFLTPHPLLHPDAGEIYTPPKDKEICFIFDGYPPISGKYKELEINFNSEQFFILSKDSSVLRILWSSLIGFELIRE